LTSATAVYIYQGIASPVLEIKNSTIEVTGTYGIASNASYDDLYNSVTKNAKITIENSTIVASVEGEDSTGLLINTPDSDVTITDSEITGQRQGAIFRGGKFTVTNTTFNSNGSDTSYADYSSGTWGDGNKVPLAALVVGNNSTGYAWSTTVTLTNVTLKTEKESSERKGFVIYQAASQSSDAEGTSRAVSVSGTLSSDSVVTNYVGGEATVSLKKGDATVEISTTL